MRLILSLMLLLPALAPTMLMVAPMEVESVTARPTYGRTQVGAAYLRLKNNQPTEDSLISAETPLARRVELHTTETKSDIMRMRKIEALKIPAHGTAELKPGAAHLMLFDLKEPLQAGMQFPLLLHFRQAGDVATRVTVEAPKP